MIIPPFFEPIVFIFFIFFKFRDIAKELTEAFEAEMKNDKGYVYYDNSVQLRILDYIDDYFIQQDDDKESSVFTNY